MKDLSLFLSRMAANPEKLFDPEITRPLCFLLGLTTLVWLFAGTLALLVFVSTLYFYDMSAKAPPGAEGSRERSLAVAGMALVLVIGFAWHVDDTSKDSSAFQEEVQHVAGPIV